MRFSRLYGSGAVMGMNPGQVDAMTLWEFAACAEGWRAAHADPEAQETPNLFTDEQIEAMGIA